MQQHEATEGAEACRIGALSNQEEEEKLSLVLSNRNRTASFLFCLILPLIKSYKGTKLTSIKVRMEQHVFKKKKKR